MALKNINDYKHLAYQRYKYGNLLGLKSTDIISTQSLDFMYTKLNALFAELKDLTFNPVNVFTSLEELRSDKGLTSYKNFTDEQIATYLTEDELTEYEKVNSVSEAKDFDKFIVADKNDGKSYFIKKSALNTIYEVNIINTEDVEKTLTLSNLPTYIVKIKDIDFKKSAINITFLDDYKDINIKLGDKKTILIDYIKDMSLNEKVLKNDNDGKTVSEEASKSYVDKLTINDIEFIKPQVSKTDMKNIVIPELDDDILIFVLDLKKTENLLNELGKYVVNKHIISKENYELKVIYDMMKNKFYYLQK